MNVGNFTKVSDKPNLRFGDIWRIYDAQFETLRDFILTLGDKYVVEEFKNGTDTALNLENSYSSGQLFLYVNGVIQWKDTDYTEVSATKIQLLMSRKVTDVIKVVIIKSNIFQVGVEAYVEKIKEMGTSSEEAIERAQRLVEAINVLEVELDLKREEFDKSKKLLEEFLVDFDGKVQQSSENLEKVKDMRDEVSEHTLESEGYLKSITDMKNAIEALALLNPEELADNEVLLARGGAVTLGERLDVGMYKFPTIDIMRQCQFLKDGDECIVTDDTNLTSLITAKIFRVCTFSGDIPSYVTEYYRTLVPDYKYAYLINEVASVPYITRELNKSHFELESKTLCQTYGLSNMTLEEFEDASGFDMTDSVTNRTLSDCLDIPHKVLKSVNFENVTIVTNAITLPNTPDYLTVMWDVVTEGSGSIGVEVSFNGELKKFPVEKDELVELRSVVLEDGTTVKPTVRMWIYITLNGNVTLKNIGWGW